MRFEDVNRVVAWMEGTGDNRHSRKKLGAALYMLLPTTLPNIRFWYQAYTAGNITPYSYIEILKLHGWL